MGSYTNRQLVTLACSNTETAPTICQIHPWNSIALRLDPSDYRPTSMESSAGSSAYPSLSTTTRSLSVGGPKDQIDLVDIPSVDMIDFRRVSETSLTIHLW